MSCGLRDVIELEALGRPAVLASSAFIDAAARQAALLGQPALARALVAHPIQDRADDEMRQLARASVTTILAAL